MMIINTANPAWGFWGSMGQQAAAGWPLACMAIAKATGKCLEDVRDFLDSRHGRHFADGVMNGLSGGASLQAAIDATTAQWMAWRIDRRAARRHGIQAGMPCLVGFVVVSATQAA